MTLNELCERLDAAKELERERNNTRREAIFARFLDDARAINRKEDSRSELEQAATEYAELREGIAAYLKGATVRDKDLVLDTLVEGARKRFREIVWQFQYARKRFLTVAESAALQEALLLNYGYAVPMNATR